MIFIHYKEEEDPEHDKNQKQKKASFSPCLCVYLVLSINSPNLLSTTYKRRVAEHKSI